MEYIWVGYNNPVRPMCSIPQMLRLSLNKQNDNEEGEEEEELSLKRAQSFSPDATVVKRDFVARLVLPEQHRH